MFCFHPHYNVLFLPLGSTTVFYRVPSTKIKLFLSARYKLIQLSLLTEILIHVYSSKNSAPLHFEFMGTLLNLFKLEGFLIREDRI